jgi:hypothetical protein
MANVKGRGIRVEIAATFGAPKVVTAVTKANPGVATSTAHAMANNTVGYFDGVSGMVQLEKQACRVKNQVTNAFDLQGLNTTQYSDFVSGNFIPVATWQTLAVILVAALAGIALAVAVAGGAVAVAVARRRPAAPVYYMVQPQAPQVGAPATHMILDDPDQWPELRARRRALAELAAPRREGQ